MPQALQVAVPTSNAEYEALRNQAHEAYRSGDFHRALQLCQSVRVTSVAFETHGPWQESLFVCKTVCYAFRICFSMLCSASSPHAHNQYLPTLGGHFTSPCFTDMAWLQVYLVNANKTDVLLLIGAIYYQLGNYEQCIAFNDRCILLDPHMAEAHANLANALQQLGNFDMAVIYYQVRGES